MEVFEAIKKRRSIRKFTDKEIPDEILMKIIDAGRWAPSGRNDQPLEVILVKDKKKLKRLREIYDEARHIGKFFEQETSFMEKGVIMIVIAEREKSWRTFSVAMSCQNMLLAATALGIGSLAIGATHRNKKGLGEIRKTYEIPESKEIELFLAFGYPDEEPAPTHRKDLKEIVHYEKY